MTREDKKKIERRAYWHDLLRQLRGTPDFPVKLFFHALFLVGAVYVATKQAILREQVKHIELISPILKAAMEHAVTAYLFVGGLALLTLLLYPFGRRAAKDQLQCIGLINHAGMPPDLLRKRRDKDNPRVTITAIFQQVAKRGSYLILPFGNIDIPTLNIVVFQQKLIH